ncbi:MAG: 3-hydroxyisobutyrate dehydrogenase [Proteobacteria bacterium]|nr:3-hydroxyisobutyrate dehydrogenase [Pseudomonadota bacterium]MBI3499874.1 3-hydroxyisobutyrate dehydrogenase [Pseudomonadota bacterium]
MAEIGFIGLGNMGTPMARNLLKAGHRLSVFDLQTATVEALAAAGAKPAASIAAAAESAEIIITMLPAGPQVRQVYCAADGILAKVRAGALLIDSSTIDVDSARSVAAAARAKGLAMLDAPVSGGVGGAEAGTLTFMVGGEAEAFARAKPLLEAMGKTIVHAGGPGNGQAAKICNNMILGISMIAVAEGFGLAKRLGLDAQTLFDISSKSSGQCWSMTTYCPVPGPVPASPANRAYKAGFAAQMMLKDLRLAQEAAQATGAATPLGAEAAQLYTLFCNRGQGPLDFSAIMTMLDGA